MKISFSLQFWQIICWLILANCLQAQENLVPNPGFEDVIDCNIEWGEIFKAEPWLITGPANPSPDLFHECANEDSFYGVPSNSCHSIYPQSGEGMAGLVNLFADEKIYARLLAPIPTDHDIYISFANFPEENCDIEFGELCSSNTQSLAFGNHPNDIPELALSSDTILNNFTDWTTLETCYQANGTEKYVFLGNYQNALRKEIFCHNYTPINFTYSYVDNVIVAAFDVVPDTIILCADEVEDFSIDFYDLPINWTDGFLGGNRTITESGTYTVQAATANCLLEDSMVIIKIPEQSEIIEETICDEANLILTSPFIGLWDNGIISSTRMVTRPGNYSVELLIDCEEENLKLNYEVLEINCGIEAFVPDIFSPNSDGINDELVFYFNSIFDFTGELIIFDRWGNHLFKLDYHNSNPTPTWNGRYKGEALDPGVYIWIFKYQSLEDQKTRILSGDVTLVR